MKKRLINSLIFTAVIVTATSFKAYAAIETYLLKDNTNVYQYNVEELKDSFMNSKIGIEDGLYKEFNNVLSNGEFHLIYDSEKKYISYNEIKNVFLEKKASEENFNLEDEIKKSKEAEAPSQVENVKIENAKVVKELFILKSDFVLDGSKISKDKYKSIHIKANNVTVSNLDISGDLVINPGNLGKVKIDNVKCNLVNVLSGDKTGIAFNKVESKEVKINANLGIEIQYEDKMPPAVGGGSAGGSENPGWNNSEEDMAKQAALKQAKTEIDSLISTDINSSQKQILQQISTSIGKTIENKNYDFNSNMTSALNGFNNLEILDQLSLSLKMYENIDLNNLNNLMDMYNINKDAIKGKIN